MARRARSEAGAPASCPRCGGQTATGQALLDHLAWCLGDPVENVHLLEAVASRDGELTQAALVAEARRRRARRSEEAGWKRP